MIQIVLVILSICLIILGIKGVTKAGLAVSKKTRLNGTPGKVVGVLCILLGVGLIPLFILFGAAIVALCGM